MIQLRTMSPVEHAADRRSRTQQILLAVDGGEAANAAVRVAADLARTKGAEVEVLTVDRPQVLPVAPAETAIIAPTSDWDSREPHRRRLELRGQLDVVTGAHTQWRIDVESGSPVEVIAREAGRRRPAILAMGLQPHRVLDRILHGGTVLKVMRKVRVPVLAVTPGLRETPRRIVVGVDFSRASLRAARVALGLVREGGTLLLAHVKPELDFSTEATEGWGVVYSQGIAGAFARLLQELDPPDSVKVDTVFLDGPVPSALLWLASAAGADLIALGTHRHGFVDRLIVGSVTEALVREARCSLLISPPADVARRPSITSR